MSAELDLYHPLILEHNRNPKYFYKMKDADVVLEAYNPVCGDEFTIYIKERNQNIKEISFSGYGCAVSKASTSMLMTKLLGKSLPEALAIINSFFNMLAVEDKNSDLDLAPFVVVKKYPSRMSCVTLSWKVIQENLK